MTPVQFGGDVAETLTMATAATATNTIEIFMLNSRVQPIFDKWSFVGETLEALRRAVTFWAVLIYATGVVVSGRNEYRSAYS